MSLDKLENITVRLEKIADKLESTNLRGSKEDGCNSAMVDAFNPILEGPVAEFMQISSKLGSEVEQASKLLKDCYIATANLIKLVAISKKPTDAKIVEILKPLSICVEQVKNFQSKSFKSPEKSHIEAIGGYISAFAWVQSPGKPQNYIGESIDSGQFYANRVLTTFKDKGPQHKEWVLALRKCFEALKDYVNDYHSMGCAWNMKGVDVGSTPSSISEPTTASKSTTTSQPPTGKLFSEINKGVGITGGLKKVDDSMKTHKNPNLRASAVVPDTKKSSSKTPTKTEITKTAKKPLFEEQGKRWLIENQKDQLTLQLDKGDKTYCAFIDSCVNSNLLINNKLNMVTILHCKGCQFQFKSGLISAVEITKCQNIKIFIDEFIPFIKLDACDSIQVHLSQKSLATQVMTNTSTSVNVHHVTAKNDYVESPIPELFVSYLKDDKLITEISHTT